MKLWLAMYVDGAIDSFNDKVLGVFSDRQKAVVACNHNSTDPLEWTEDSQDNSLSARVGYNSYTHIFRYGYTVTSIELDKVID